MFDEFIDAERGICHREQRIKLYRMFVTTRRPRTYAAAIALVVDRWFSILSAFARNRIPVVPSGEFRAVHPVNLLVLLRPIGAHNHLAELIYNYRYFGAD